MSELAFAEFKNLPFLVLSGPSGSGKTTIVSELLRVSPVKLVKSISATTRPPRKGEVHGRDYYFLTPEEFAQRRTRGDFLECAEVHSTGNWYGTLKSEVQRAREAGGWSLLEIDVQGAMRVMQEYPQVLSIFLLTQSFEDYENRLRARGTDSPQIIERRLENARNELKYADRYRYRVVNDQLERAVTEIVNILTSWEAQFHAR